MPSLQSKPARLALKNLLYATDFSAASEMALPYVKGIARHYGSTVLVAHVYAAELRCELPMVPSEFHHNREAAERRMAAFLLIHSLTSIPHETVLKSGDVWLGLSGILEKNDIDLLIVGTHGRKGLMTLLLGSMAEEMIRCVSCPVLTIAPHVSLARGAADGEFRNILFATSLSNAPEKALRYAVSLAEESAAKLTLLHVVEEAEPDSGAPYPEPELVMTRQMQRTRFVRAREELCEMLPTGVELWCKPKLSVLMGSAPEIILHEAEAEHADLIVLGARRSRAPQLSSHAPWRTVHRVIGEAHCPVLTVRD